jgi:hypothetical protein
MENVEKLRRALIHGQRRRKKRSVTGTKKTATKLHRLGVRIGKVVSLDEYRRRRRLNV